jgi:hypothetical protein
MSTSSDADPPLLPKRIIDVSTTPVRLYEPVNQSSQYVCLSHCWGGVRPPCRTTTVTLESNKVGIEWDQMPATFQDAIDFTRRLGYQYLWIDSICIIQDSYTDWAEQSALMATIYENAHLTICATGSMDDNGGLYHTVPQSLRPRELEVQKKNGSSYVIFVEFDAQDRHIPDWYMVTNRKAAVDFPLMARGWTYQERLLSRRLIHFSKAELTWECSEISQCQCCSGNSDLLDRRGSPYMRHNSVKKTHKRAIEGGALKNYWNEIVYPYSGLQLSFDKDKLPALSGVAKQILKFRPGDEYLAGCWSSTIVPDLRWARHGGGERTPRPREYRSPSWSWASLNAPTHTEYYDSAVKGNQDYAKCLEYSVSPAGPDPTGEVSTGFIVIQSQCRVAQLRDNPGGQIGWDRWMLTANDLEVKFNLDCELDADERSFETGQDMLCLRLGMSQYGSDICLVLKEGNRYNLNFDGHEGPLYERVGCFTCKREELQQKWFTTGETMTVKII